MTDKTAAKPDGMTGQASTPATKRPRKRSPNYPVLNLEDAIARTKVLYDEDATHYMPIHLAHERWKYKPFGSIADQTTAALRAYGLLDVDGEAKKRRVRVSDSGERVIRSAPNRDVLIREAALRPAIHRELWEKFAQSGLPSDGLIRSYLEWERPAGTFNKDVVDDVIKRFRETIEFANLKTGDIIEDGKGEDGGRDGEDDPPEKQKRDRDHKSRMNRDRQVTKDSVEEVFNVPEGGEVVIQFPSRLSVDTFTDLSDWLKIVLRKIERSVQRAESEESAGS